MYLSSKFLSTLTATLGLYLVAGCVSSIPNISVDESIPQTAAVDIATSSTLEPTASKTEPTLSTAEATPSNPESAPLTAEVILASGNEPAAVFAENGIAIRGADPVAYFTESRYVPGSADYIHEWGGAIWQFASAENRALFARNPEQYAPQYGGFCAWAVSQGYTAAIDPTAWRIVDGKLYLNFDARIQRRWQQDIPGNIARADQNWPGVVSN